MTSTPRRQSAYAIYSRNSTSTTETSVLEGDAPKTTVKRQKTKVVTRTSTKNPVPVTTTKRRLRNKTKSRGNSKTKMIVRKSVTIKSDADNQRISDEDELDDDDVENQMIIEGSQTTSDEDLPLTEISLQSRKKKIQGNGILSAVGTPARGPAVPKTIPCGTEAADTVFKWLINPISTDAFFKEIFEIRPFHLKRKNPTFYEGLFAANDFNKIIKENYLNYAKHIDIVAYVDGERRPVENEMPVHPDFVWNQYMEGYSVRMRNPQAYHKGLWKVCSLLQEYFSSSVGANMYLTPANSQGFPPHYDDIDAFILQIEGKKHWRVYTPQGQNNLLPRFSSGDLNEYEIGNPCLEIEVEPGDLLYIPRGFVHQADATDEHSLHITISTNQLNTWADYFKRGLPKALEIAAANNVEFRKSLPKDYYEHVGFSFAPNVNEKESCERRVFKNKVKELSRDILKCFPVDATADEHAIDFIHSCMPPCFNGNEAESSIHGNGHKFQNGIVKPVSLLTPETKIRWIRRRAFRLVIDEQGNRLVNTLGNSKNSKEEELMFMEVEDDVLPAVTLLFKKHPEYIAIKDLPIYKGIDGKLAFAEGLYAIGYLMTEEPLPTKE